MESVADRQFKSPLAMSDLGKPSAKLIVEVFDGVMEAQSKYNRAVDFYEAARKVLAEREKDLTAATQHLEINRATLERLFTEAAKSPATYREFKKARGWRQITDAK